MEAIDINGQSYELTQDNRLKYPDVWTEEIASELAAKEGVHLTREHWHIINLMRDYYHEYNIPPIMKLLIKVVSEKYGKEYANEAYLNSLFPGDVVYQGTRIAGLPLPRLDAELDRKTHEYLSAYRQKKTPLAKKPEPNHFVDEFQFEGKTCHVTKHGNLVEQHYWSKNMAEFLAQKEDIKLSEEHWEIILFLRKFYFDYGITPMVRLLMKHMRQTLGKEKSSEDYVYKLFPGGPSRQGSRIAGLSEPQGCID